MLPHEFRDFLFHQSAQLYRPMPWRDDTRPYYVLVSELMLQQTQVSRVLPKFNQFIATFPHEAALAQASLAEVLRQWQGLGYNRRAKYLHDGAKMIVHEGRGNFPTEEHAILRLPGVGKNTCGAIRAYAFNEPSIFVETNIRTVYIHHFFADNFAVDDTQIAAKLRETIDTDHPREFYWALMDYGAHLKTNGVRNNSQSKQYRKQPQLAGSIREMRGQLIQLLLDKGRTKRSLEKQYENDARLLPAIESLEKDGLIIVQNEHFYLTK
ncbi:A/G-specific adenine glycosylase [Candidatus Saccharibacteria bacterium]|nr:A/G-specific adenine glycosylase [Candidatus Saccharibacteria bacterium]